MGRLGADFWRLWSAAVVSRLGGGVASAGLPLLAASLTRDPRQVALVSVFAGLPWLLLALHTGALADRWDRRRTMWLCDLASALVMAGLALGVLVGAASLWVLCAAAFAAASISTLFDSAGQAALPSLVARDQLPAANSRLYTGTVLAGLFVGPPVGSWLFVAHPAVPFAVDAVSFVGSAALVFAIRSRFRAPESSGTGLTREIGDGVRWLWRHRRLRSLVVLLTVWNLTETAVLGVLVLYALERLQVPPSAYGLLLTGVAVGGVLGAAAAPRAERWMGTGPLIVVTVALTVLADVGLALTRSAVVAGLLLGVVGVAAFAFNVVSSSYRQSVVPDLLQGRVSSAYRFATWGIAPVGAALGGVVAAGAGLPAVFWGAAAVLAVAGLATARELLPARLAVDTPS
ncbi:MFS transporter [Klenkia brasiliensis]|uniref:Predicted arabinose efflux permease, MFS family n=1 Tax=Klenkia brasiliensis TaxID=333142 RepID=A0A1G7ZSA7_9ACTN|nr:MFS transporter [Klenkia brasiliensis]SDH11585.1 Predicted arabinose efflux permease, MFS family [Klenkia brasiliensis]